MEEKDEERGRWSSTSGGWEWAGGSQKEVDGNVRVADEKRWMGVGRWKEVDGSGRWKEVDGSGQMEKGE